MALVGRVLPEPTRDERLAALQRAIERAHENGVTSIQNASGSVEDLELYDELRKRGTLDLRVYTALSASPGLSAAEIAKFEAARTTFADDPVLKAGAIKLMLDGVVESHTAAMLEPYANRATNGQLNFTHGRARSSRLAARQERLADLHPRHRRSRRSHGARRVRARAGRQSAARARPAPPHRAHRDHRPRRHPPLRVARRHRRAAAVPRKPGPESDRPVDDEPGRDAREPRLAVPQPADERRARRLRQRLAGRPARPAAWACTSRPRAPLPAACRTAAGFRPSG